jgi:Reverse transcriptase (RNA-dependent DNA polymerase)
MAKDDPVTTAAYAKEHGLLDTPGWKRFKRIARREKKFQCMLKEARLSSSRRGIRYKFGVRLPRNWNEAVQIDSDSGNTLWQDAIKTELNQINEYNTFKDIGVGGNPGSGFKKINVHLVFDVKHDLRRKARLVAGSHLTDPPKESAYSGVVSFRSLRIVALLAELNGLAFWAADVGNAYLEAHTKEKVYIIAGPEFGELQWHTLVIIRALYGLRTSGARWHERFSDTLRDLGFVPSTPMSG